MTQHKVIGIDLAKSIFFLFEINHKGKNIGRKKLQRDKLLDYIAIHYCNGGVFRSSLLGS